jgi:uncharacterized protein
VSYGAFWWSLALFVLFLHDKGAGGLRRLVPVPVGRFHGLHVGGDAFRSPRALQLVFLALWITFFLLAASAWTGLARLHQAGGYGGLVTALLAFYVSAAEIINDAHGRSVLPVGVIAGNKTLEQPQSAALGQRVLAHECPHVGDSI